MEKKYMCQFCPNYKDVEDLTLASIEVDVDLDLTGCNICEGIKIFLVAASHSSSEPIALLGQLIRVSPVLPAEIAVH